MRTCAPRTSRRSSSTRSCNVITEHKWVLEGDLRREIAANLKRLQAINCYRAPAERCRSLPVPAAASAAGHQAPRSHAAAAQIGGISRRRSPSNTHLSR